MKTKKITLIGNGNIGQAILYLLKNNQSKYLIDVYDKDAEKNKNGKSLKECVTDADFIFLCVPSWCLSEALKDLTPYLSKKTILISLAKGINQKSNQSVDQIIEKATKNKYALLSGPMFAIEINEGKMSYAILASYDKKVYSEVSTLFRGTKIKLVYSKEVHSVAISAVLKNIYALLSGILIKFDENNNTKGYFACEALREMRDIMKILKLKEEVIFGISGMGDFIATASSVHSQNIKVGRDIFENNKTNLLSEGLLSLPSLIKKIGKESKQLPLLSMLEKIVIKKKDAKKEIENYFQKL